MRLDVHNHHTGRGTFYEGATANDIRERLVHDFPWLEGDGDLRDVIEHLASTQAYDVSSQDDLFAPPDVGAPHVALVMAYDAAGRLLLGERTDSGRFTLPGGHLDPGEDPAEGAARELMEETGLVGFSMTPLPVKPNPPGAPVLHVFSALVAGTPHGHLDPDRECEKWKFFDVRDGLDPAVWDRLAGPPGEINVVRQVLKCGARDELVKSEPALLVKSLLDHGDARERALATYGPLSRGDLLRACLDPHPDTRAAALARPDVTPEFLRLLCAARRLTNGQHPGRAVVDFLMHRHATPAHADVAEAAAEADPSPAAREAADLARQARDHHALLDGGAGEA